MRIVRRIIARARGAFRHSADDADLQAEMASHLQMATDEYIRRGLSPDDARRRALVDAGGLTQATEQVREQRGLPWLETFASDVRYALRHSRRAPLSTATMILVLSLGIGTSVVVLTLLNSISTMPAPGILRDASLVRVRGAIEHEGRIEPRLMSWVEVTAYAARSETFSDVAAYAEDAGMVGTGDATRRPVRLIYVTPNYFALLGVAPALGSPPAGDPVRLTTSPTALISYAMWQQEFGGRADIVGRRIQLNGIPVTITGVAPPRFLGTDGGSRITVWVPLAAYPQLNRRSDALFSSPDSLFLGVAARLRPGVDSDRAGTIAAATVAQLPGRSDSGPVSAPKRTAQVVPMLASNARMTQESDIVSSSLAAMGFSILVLLITCINVSALLVGLAVARRREIGVRLSLGASRQRLIRQLLTESVLLATAAAVLGLALTIAGIRFAGASLDDIQLVVDWKVTAATVAVALLAGLGFGISPALHATRVSISAVLKGSSGVATRSRLQRGLVVAQIALTLPLLAGLGTVVNHAMSRSREAPVAAPVDQLVEVELDPWSTRLSPPDVKARIDGLVSRLGGLPGVIAAMPLSLGTSSARLVVHPADRAPGVPHTTLDARLVAAPPGYFHALDIPVRRGRDFDRAEQTPGSDPRQAARYPSIIIGDDLATRLWPGANPLGKRLALAGANGQHGPPMTVVGVVESAAAGRANVAGEARVFVPYATMNDGVLVRTAGPGAAMLSSIRSAVTATAPDLPVVRVETIEQRQFSQYRAALAQGAAVSIGGILALLLSAIGLYAVVALGVAQRTREIGIRTALGAAPRSVVRMFFVRGLALTIAGLAIGTPVSIAVILTLTGTFGRAASIPPIAAVAIGGMVLLVASVAVWIPARRASNVDPLLALRND